MFKRTKGYFLLTLLVVTGFAGRMHSDTLSGKERFALISALKDSRSGFLKSIDGLSSKQLRYRSGKNKSSIKDYIFQLACTEKNLWEMTKGALKQESVSSGGNSPALPVGRFIDESLYPLLEDQLAKNENALVVYKSNFKTSSQAVKTFEIERAEQLRYLRTTTENVRTHYWKTSLGVFDAYQLMSMNAICNNYFIKKIERLKAAPGFPH